MKKILLLLFIISASHAYAQSVKVQLTGRYNLDTALTDTGRLADKNTMIPLLKMEQSHVLCGKLNGAIVYFRAVQVKQTPEFLQWVHRSLDSLDQKQKVVDDKQKALIYKKNIALYGKRNASDIANRIIRLGQPRKVVIIILGQPTTINRTVTSQTVEEQLVYEISDSKTEYYYITNGVLTSFQD